MAAHFFPLIIDDKMAGVTKYAATGGSAYTSCHPGKDDSLCSHCNTYIFFNHKLYASFVCVCSQVHACRGVLAAKQMGTADAEM